MLKTHTGRAALLLALLVAPHAQSAAQLAPAEEARGGGVRVVVKGGAEVSLYAESHALVIGVSDYTRGWPSLSGVKQDVEKVAGELKRHGFTMDIVLNPTRADFDRALRRFVSRYGHKEDSRLLVYFAGHGYTNRQNYGVSVGYLVPSDAPNPERDMEGFKEAAISMSEVEVYAHEIESRHALFLFDSCFSGSIFETRGAPTPPSSITSLVALPVRQFIAAGTAEQTVSDRSFFRAQFVDGLEGAADSNGDGYVTGSELGIFLQNTVTDYTRNTQTPRWGKIDDPLLNKGDFIFVVPRGGETPGVARPAQPPRPDTKVLAEGYGADGEKLYEARKYEQAENEFRLAVHFEPAGARWRLGLARSLHGQDLEAEAEAASREAARLAPADPSAFLLLGDALAGQKKMPDAESAWNDALLLYREAARRSPSDATQLGGVADALERLGRKDEALASRREAVRLAPRSADAHWALSEILWKLDKRDEALAELREAARLEPASAERQDKLADKLEDSRMYAEALVARRAALRLDPKKIRYYARFAYHYGCYGGHADPDAEIARVYREAVRNLPDEPGAYTGLAEHLKGAEAERVLREGLSRLPASADLYVALGVLFTRQSKAADREAAYKNAAESYRKAIQLDPKNSTLYVELGSAYSILNKRVEAEAVYREGLNISPSNEGLLDGLIWSLKAQDKSVELEAAYRRAIMYRPHKRNLHEDLAKLLVSSKKYADAEREYRESARLDPQDATARASLAETLKAQGRASEAVAAYREAVRLRPDVYGYYFDLGKYLEELKDYATLEAVFRDALSHLKEDWERVNSYNFLGEALANQNKHAEAEAVYKDALRIDPKRAWTHYALGISFWNQERPTEAEPEFREAVRLEPDNKSFREMLDKFLAARKK